MNTDTKHQIKTEYTHAKADARKALRRSQAEARRLVYDQKSPVEKLVACVNRRGESKREVARLKSL